MVYQVGDNVESFPLTQFHTNVNKDPWMGYCLLCGRKVGENPKVVYFDWQGFIDPAKYQDDSGWLFAVGNECAKKFDEKCFSYYRKVEA